MQRNVIAIKRSLSLMTGAVLLLPAAGWCAEGGGEAAGGGSWLSLLFYVFNFAVFAWILVHYAGPAARKFFADRAGGIKETFARAEATYKEAQDLANRAAERMSKLEAEKEQLHADLDAETVYIANRIREMARETALRIVRDTELTGAAITEAAQRRVRATLAAATGRRARDLMVKSFTGDDQARLLRGFEEKLAQEARR
ncbi:MAG TPA: ATP synthase F0 subunit B [Candidatus Binataceae bacterium]|nr:ATP synthase F0 subunit B [Candidatus Binataceae bacterium]